MRKSISKKICVAVALTMMLGAVSGCGVQEKTQNSSVDITGEEKGNGILYINSKYEGIEVYKHLCISGGIINMVSLDDGINTKI